MSENTGTEWQETDVEASAEAYDEYVKRRGSTFPKRPPQGRSIWRWLPPLKGKKPVPFTYVWVHYFNDPTNLDTLLMVGVCPSKQRGEPCRICPFVSALRKSGVEADKDVADRIRAKEAILANVVRIDDANPKPSVMDVPTDVHKLLMQTLRDKAEGVDFTHPTKGYNVIVEREGEKLKTKYTARLAPRQLPIQKMEWLKEMQDLDVVFGELDDARLANMLVLGESGKVEYRAPLPAGEDRQLPAADGAIDADWVENPLTGEREPRAR